MSNLIKAYFSNLAAPEPSIAELDYLFTCIRKELPHTYEEMCDLLLSAGNEEEEEDAPVEKEYVPYAPEKISRELIDTILADAIMMEESAEDIFRDAAEIILFEVIERFEARNNRISYDDIEISDALWERIECALLHDLNLAAKYMARAAWLASQSPEPQNDYWDSLHLGQKALLETDHLSQQERIHYQDVFETLKGCFWIKDDSALAFIKSRSFSNDMLDDLETWEQMKYCLPDYTKEEIGLIANFAASKLETVRKLFLDDYESYSKRTRKLAHPPLYAAQVQRWGQQIRSTMNQVCASTAQYAIALRDERPSEPKIGMS